MDDVRKHWSRRPWHTSTVSVADRLDSATDDDDDEYEVDGITSRKYTYGKYRYAVSFKGYDETTKHLPRDDPDLENCQQFIDDFDARHPLGSLPHDQQTDKDVYLSGQSGQRRRSTRLRHAIGLSHLGCWHQQVGT
eukprot:SAG31_NODE_1095_length_9928_cov_5.441042_2_plen_136_part_00